VDAADPEPVMGASEADLSLEPEFREAKAPVVDSAPILPDRDEPPLGEEPPSMPHGEPAPEPQPAFVRQAHRRAFWRRPWVRVGLGAVVLVLMGLLVLQAMYLWRDQLASRMPASKPALHALCGRLDCEIVPPRPIDDVVIDSSVLLRRSPGLYSFNVVIRNKSGLEVAAPSLELTLTDHQDQVLVRRVLLPAEWPRPIETLPPGAEWALQFDLALAELSDQVMTGYRAILFYP
jgi:hypothetical protein